MTTTSSTTTFTPITIDASVLVAYYTAKSGTAAAASSATTKAAGAAPSAPWSKGVTTATLTAAATRVLNGGSFIDPSSAKLDAATRNTDYKNLFALYQGLSSLEGLAQSAQDATLSGADRLRLQSKFADGLAQVQGFVAGAPFKTLTVTPGAAAANVTSASGVKAENDSYVTQTLATGSANDPVAAFAGDVRFSMTVTRGGAASQVNFDLAEISGPRSLASVEQYMNGKLQAAGALTRVSIADTPGEAQTITAGGQTFPNGTAPDSLALSIDGTPSEAISFSAPAATASVYLAQTADTGSGSALSLSKLDPTGASGASTLFTQKLPAGVSAVRASATGPDGSLYVLADLDGATPDGQTVKGSGDTALLRYDSAGALTYTRTLGAAGAASGYGLSISPDGASIAVTGTVTGALDGGSGADAATADSFVSVFDAAQGVERWTTRAGGAEDDRPAAVAWGADGSVYIAGRTDAGLEGVARVGGTDAYVQGFSKTGARTFATVYGTSGTDAAAGLVVTPDESLVTAGVENGHAVLRRFTPPFADGAQASQTRDLGSLGGGSIAGLGLAADGSLILAGTASGGLSLGATQGGAYTGGRQVFAADLSASLAPSASDSGTWWTPPKGQDATAASAVVQGGQVYVTGQTTGPPTAGQSSSSLAGYAVALDPRSGAVGWSRSFTSQDGQDTPATIAVDATGVSALDKLGFPKGALTFAGATDLATNTSLRAGDSFQIGVGSARPATVTIDPGETLSTLIDKITAATGGRAAATVSSSNGYDRLAIAPASSQSVLKLVAGPDGYDALKGLGLSPTLLTTVASTAKAPTAAPYALGLSGTYDLSSAASAKAAFQALAGAVTAVEKAYTDMSAPPPTPGKTGGTVPAYLTAQIAQYQNALARLTGSS